MKNSEYLKLARKIAEKPNHIWLCCNDLPRKYARKFEKWFKPTDKEIKKYNHDDYVWMDQLNHSNEENNNFRILALCLMHEISLTEGGEQ